METPRPLDRRIHLEGRQMLARNFLLGNEGGFVLLSPVELNNLERNLLPMKWFGASEFGRKYLEAQRVWMIWSGLRTLLCRGNQVAFDQDLHEAVRHFRVEGISIRQRYFIPNRWAAVVMTLEADRPVRFVVEPQFDMRYYASFSTSFDGYCASSEGSEDAAILKVSNRTEGPDKSVGEMKFAASIRNATGPLRITMLPENKRLRKHVYLKDEHREKLIHKAYAEIHELSPDEAPIWDQYENTVYVPAELEAAAPVTLVYSFDEDPAEAERIARSVTPNIDDLFSRNETEAVERMQRGLFQTGNAQVDLAYNQILSRFNSCLVARDVDVRTGGHEMDNFTAIFAGDKYFLDPWKRDENVSLEALLLTNDFETSRAILDDTWQYQDSETGRLPQIIQLGQPLVYFSSDGTPWALRRLRQYTNASGDETLRDAKYPMLERFFEAGLDSCRNGLLPSGAVKDHNFLWETWEDTQFTPRDGYPVEIELLWLTAVTQYLPMVRDRNSGLAERMEEALEAGCRSFEMFYLDGYLADSIDYNWRPRRLLTANGFIAFPLGFPLPAGLAESMVRLAREQLAGRVGVKSLATRDWPKVLSRRFLSDPNNVHDGTMASVGIYNYHRGIEWLWLNQFLLAGELALGETDGGYERYVAPLVREALERGGVAGLDELHDLHGPLGADFQAWSMAGFVACLHQFAGVTVDAESRVVSLRPSIPSQWPELASRRRVGGCWFDLECRRESDEAQTVTVAATGGAPAGFELQVGARIPSGRTNGRVLVDGEEPAAEDLEIRNPFGSTSFSELWVRRPFADRMTVEFLFDRD
ncbi:MAG TPA: amylo-alpha-1,6-glucosidase [Chloroflexota bacterium]|nr:amylo-alpha-1,6-glucosidase [Chloroflexota bacterium]